MTNREQGKALPAESESVVSIEERVGRPHYIVGIGSSAGGLEALRTLIGGLTNADRMSLVVAQHLAPQHRSRLAEIIGHDTALTVQEIESSAEPRPRTVYIAPPNKDVVLEGGRLVLRNPEKVGPKPSVDLFFRSLADELGENAIGIVLSGTGSDGAQGIRAIKAAGGVTFVQSLTSAKYDGMPRAAKLTGAVDLELPLEDIARQLVRLNELAAATEGNETPLRRLALTQDPFDQILSHLARTCRVDFGQYKPSTLRRRIERRIVATRCESAQQYVEYLQAKPDESRLLFQDILISVTSFFRDPEPFETLARHLQERVAKKAPGGSVRVWVPGCATGEEAYSIAILLAEAVEGAHRQLSVQVFATDIDERAMGAARKGAYPPGSIDEVPAHLRAKYFEETPEEVRVRNFIREMVIFARHDVGQDPPFLKLDLISCRNVLIYFGAVLQEQVLKAFHYGLDANGLLFLGKSEATGAAAGHFELVDKASKLFTRAGGRGDLPRSYSRQEMPREQALITKDRESRWSHELLNAVVGAFAPDSVLVDEEYRVRHLYGAANQYLNLPRGEPSSILSKLVPPDMVVELSALLHRASRLRKSVRGEQRHEFVVHGERRIVQLSVAPVAHDGRIEYFVTFNPVPAEPRRAEPRAPAGAQSADERVAQLEEQLLSTQEHLQSVVEAYETANEELQALNEELQSSNEELQSTNEELETTNEELQSANEELTTLNEEINVKSAELVGLNQRYQAIQNAIAYPLLVVDPQLRLTDFNPSARFLLRIGEADRGQPVRALAAAGDLAESLAMIEQSLRQRRDAKRQLRIGERQFEVRVQLFQGAGRDTLDGAIVSFVDNTELVRALEQSRLHQERLSAILENTPAVVSMKDPRGVYVYVNRRFLDVVGLTAEEVIGRTSEEVFGPAGSALRERDFEVLMKREATQVEEELAIGGRTLNFLSSKFPLLDERRTVLSVVTVALDVTEKVHHERQLELFRRIVSSSNAGLAIFEKEQEALVLTHASEELARRVESSADALRGTRLDALLDRLLTGVPSARAAELARAIAGQPSTSATLNFGERAGSEEWLELKSTAIALGPDARRHVILTLFEVTQRVQSQKTIQRQQEDLARFGKLAALGEVAAGISHEINTPLQVITTQLDLLRALARKGRLDESSVDAAASEIDRTVDSITHVIAGLRTLTGMEPGQLHVTDALDLIREAARLCTFRLEQAEAPLTLDLPPGPVLVACQPVQIVQICINLLNNAADAVSDLRERWVKVDARTSAGRLLVRIVDSGRGIDPSLAERIMTPFFTTKRARHGTGLGLSLSRSIAKQHGGDLRLVVDSQRTCFELELPVREPSPS